MKVLIVSTSERAGGGAIAARRLMDALNRRKSVEAKMMVRDKQSADARVIKVGSKMPKLMERVFILPQVAFRKGSWKSLRSRLWQVDTGDCGIDITRTREFQEADIVHLHWACQGMLSLSGILRILRSGKRIVWTLHDEWPYLGVCHYRGDCTEEECDHCPIMWGGTPHYVYTYKHLMYYKTRPTFVGCSQWITDRACKNIPPACTVHINNCVPTKLFHPRDMQRSRRRLSLPKEKRLLLFCSQKVTDERKGIAYLIEAIRLLPRLGLREGDLHLVIVGKGSEQIPLPGYISVTRLGSVGEREMAVVYNAVDVFLTPSLQDNLPNTIAEAMCSGTPCVGFDVGGIPEMIDHQVNGYVARYRDAVDLAEGIVYVLDHNLREAAYRSGLAAYSESLVAQQHVALYNALLK